MSSHENLNLVKPTFSLADIEEQRPCNADKLLEWLGVQGEVAITPGTVRRAAYLDLLSCNWFAGRFLTIDACYAWQSRAIYRMQQEGVAVNWWWPLLNGLFSESPLSLKALAETLPPMEHLQILRGCMRLQYEIMVRELVRIIKEGDSRYATRQITVFSGLGQQQQP